MLSTPRKIVGSGAAASAENLEGAGIDAVGPAELIDHTYRSGVAPDVEFAILQAAAVVNDQGGIARATLA